MISKGFILISILIALLNSMLLFPEFALSEETVDKVIAIVNDEVIMLSEIQEASAPMMAEILGIKNPEERDKKSNEVVSQVLDKIIDFRVQVQEAKKEGMEISEDETEEALNDTMTRMKITKEKFPDVLKEQGMTLDELKKELKDQLLVKRIVRKRVMSRISVSNEEIQEYFKNHKEQFESSLKFRVRHIAMKVDKKAGKQKEEEIKKKMEEVLSMLRNNEDFTEIAKKFSEDPSKDSGGDLGILNRGELLPLFEEAILKLEEGAVSDIIGSEAGFHIFKLEWKEKLTPEAELKIKDQIKESIERNKFQIRYEAWLKELRAKAVIKKKM